MKFSYRSAVLILAIVFAVANPHSICAGTLLTNGGFDIAGPGLSPPNYPASISGAAAAGPSSAASWNLYNNFNATTSTELLPTTDPLGSGSMIHLTSATNTGDPAGSFFNGLQQSFAQVSGASAAADVYVLSGPVILALYTGNGSTLLDFTATSTVNQWETLSVTAPLGTNPDLVVIYSYSATGTGEFYAENAAVTALPEPATWMMVLLGLPLAGYWSRKILTRKAA
jgi:hypothetical protein